MVGGKTKSLNKSKKPMKAFISKNVHNSSVIYLQKEFYFDLNNQRPTAIQTLENLAVWRTSIEDEKNPYIGWEFSKKFTVEMLQVIFERLTGMELPID